MISQAKNELVRPEAYLDYAGHDSAAVRTQKLYAAYQAQLQQNQAVDFDDLISSILSAQGQSGFAGAITAAVSVFSC